MTTLVPISLTSKTNPSRYKQGGDAELLNCYVERTGEEGKTDWAIYAIEGLKEFAFATQLTGGIRAMLPVNQYLYFVAGTYLYRSDTLGNVTQITPPMNISATAPVYMERNRREVPDVAIVCDGAFYYYRDNATPVNGSKLFQVTTSPTGLQSPYTLAFVDGYFITSTTNAQWQVGALDDAATWSSVDYGRADANPDSVVRVSALQRDAVIFGEYSTEFWRNTGAVDFPFERVSALDIGCIAPDSVANIEQTLAWVAHDRTVRMLNGYNGQRISTHAVERDIQKVLDPTTIKGTSWTYNGHSFYSITSTDWTWVYDSITGLWHTRKSTKDKEDLPNWRIFQCVSFNNKVIAGDRTLSKLYEMSSDVYEEAGNPIKMEVILPPVHAYPKWLTFHSFYIDVEKGVGRGSEGATEDQDPSLLLRWSHDGGYTFNGGRSLKLGQQGDRTRRVRTYRLGQANPDGYVFKIEAPSKTVRAIYACAAEIDST